METIIKSPESITPERRAELLGRLAEYATTGTLPSQKEMLKLIATPDAEVQRTYRTLIMKHSRGIITRSIGQAARH